MSELRKSIGERLTELRRSGAAGKHGDRRLKRLKTRAAQKRKAADEDRG